MSADRLIAWGIRLMITAGVLGLGSFVILFLWWKQLYWRLEQDYGPERHKKKRRKTHDQT